ncbi:MAG: DUF2974 domain-containing protein [Treponema sp.]|nr:DUF2974 domain-containing protein [Treponema sp.]
MADFFDYLSWRGDLDFSASPFNDVDALIFTQLVYLNFDGLVPPEFGRKIVLSELAAQFKNAPDFDTRKNVGLVINEKCVDLLFACAQSVRFGAVWVSGYVNKYNAGIEEQFSAALFSTDDFSFVSFRGTDDTIVGWKEDFNLAYLEKIPAQEDALSYLKKAVALGAPVLVGGHSKGGNLAIYASAKLGDTEKEKISAIYNFDGPGFLKETLASVDFASVQEKTKSFFPQFSMIGMVFHHFPEYTVVKSEQKYILQHDPFSWFVGACALVSQEKLDGGSQYFYKTFNSWFGKLSAQKREEFVDTFFGVLEAPNAKNLSELMEHWGKNSLQIVKAIASLDRGTRKSALSTALSIFKEAGASLPDVLPV